MPTIRLLWFPLDHLKKVSAHSGVLLASWVRETKTWSEEW